MIKVSIIIPVYNSQLFLKKCLDGFLNQTLKDIEIIVINDGSTDNSLEVIEEYKNIKLINQTNQGAASARNLGLKHAKGEYILFFDSDDYLEPDTIEKMYNCAILNNCDIVIAKSLELKNNQTKELDSINLKYQNTNNIFQFSKGWAWDKLFRREFIIKNNLEFQNLRHSNDAYFIYMALMLTNKISIVDEILITHRVHNNSLSNTKEKEPLCFYFALKKIYKNLPDKKYLKSFIAFALELSFWHFKTSKNKFNFIKKLANFNELKKLFK